MFHIDKCCYISARRCFTFINRYRFIYYESLYINAYRVLSQPSAGFLFGGIMRNTKQYGLVSSWQEHQMLIRAQHTYEKLHSKRKPAYSKSVPTFSLDNPKRRCGEMT